MALLFRAYAIIPRREDHRDTADRELKDASTESSIVLLASGVLTPAVGVADDWRDSFLVQ